MAEHPAVTFIGIHDRTPDMRILYVSTNTLQALHYAPEELVGRSPSDLIADEESEKVFQQHHGCSASNDNIIITRIIGRRKDSLPVFMRSMAFACGNVCVHLSTAYPDVPTDSSSDLLSTRRFSYNLNGSSQNKGTSKSGANRDTVKSLKRPHQACIVLEDLKANNTDGNKGARIIFVTDSINRILNVDSCDLQGVPFLSLISIEDITRAAAFLEKSLYSNHLVHERLRILVSPLEESQLENPQCATVELMAMGSDEGAIMLCQLDQPKSRVRNDGYLTLEEIISSNAETSDFELQ